MSFFTGTKWGGAGIGSSGGQVEWSFAQSGGALASITGFITEGVFQAAIRSAFDAWEALANIDFVEVSDTASSDIRLGWSQIDGEYGTVGEAYWTSSGTSTIHSEIIFDLTEQWETLTSAGIDFVAVAVHEIGHAIGLGHTDDPSSVMYPYVADDFSGMPAYDVSSIQELYGPAVVNLILVGTGFADLLIGKEGPDFIQGFEGSDSLSGAQGADTIFGNQGADMLLGNEGTDVILGGQDDDLVFGGKDADHIEGNFGADTIYGNLGADIIFGGRDNDYLHGGQDNDTLTAGLGSDMLIGGLGDDTLAGGDGADTFVFSTASGYDAITDFSFSQGDHLDLQGQTYTVSSDVNGMAELFLSGGGLIVLIGVTEAEFDMSIVA